MNNLRKIANSLRRAQNIAIFTHSSPDFDALGSSFALYYGLKSLGKEAIIFIKDELSKTQGELFDLNAIDKGICDTTKFDAFVAVDNPSLQRFGDNAFVFNTPACQTLIIDHHRKADEFGDISYRDPQSSSCCELVYKALKLMRVKLTTQMLSCIYLGLMTDTNAFTNANTTIQSFKMACKLIKSGINTPYLNEKIFKTMPLKEATFKKFLWDNFQVKENCAYVLVSYAELQNMDGTLSDVGGFSSSLIAIDNMHYSFSLVEYEIGKFSLSIRSKLGYNAIDTATALGGGGHLYAAGAKFECKDMDTACKKVLRLLKKDEKQN